MSLQYIYPSFSSPLSRFFPLAFDAPVFGPSTIAFDIEGSREMQASSCESGAYDTAPAELVAMVERRIDYLNKAVESDRPSELFTHASKYYDLMVSSVDEWYTQVDDQVYSPHAAYSKALSESEDIAYFQSAASLPALQMLSYLFGLLPGYSYFGSAHIVSALGVKASDDGVAVVMPKHQLGHLSEICDEYIFIVNREVKLERGSENAESLYFKYFAKAR